jgi:hypothetical protein
MMRRRRWRLGRSPKPPQTWVLLFKFWWLDLQIQSICSLFVLNSIRLFSAQVITRYLTPGEAIELANLWQPIKIQSHDVSCDWDPSSPRKLFLSLLKTMLPSSSKGAITCLYFITASKSTASLWERRGSNIQSPDLAGVLLVSACYSSFTRPNIIIILDNVLCNVVSPCCCRLHRLWQLDREVETLAVSAHWSWFLMASLVSLYPSVADTCEGQKAHHHISKSCIWWWRTDRNLGSNLNDPTLSLHLILQSTFGFGILVHSGSSRDLRTWNTSNPTLTIIQQPTHWSPTEYLLYASTKEMKENSWD